jgi:indolepyruvate ferredoxin oxidoreductase
VNDDVRPTVGFARNAKMDLSPGPMMRTLDRATGGNAVYLDAGRIASSVMGDAIYTNMFLLGYALQQGRLPVSVEALERAIELNGVAVKNNLEALRWGRLAAHDFAAVQLRVTPSTSSSVAAPTVRPKPAAESLDELIARRRDFLVRYQDEAYADRYERLVRTVIAAEQERTPGRTQLSWAVARNLHKLMAYKDEYEVARLYVDPSFRQRLNDEFEGDFTFKVNLAPQLFNTRDARTGRAKKWEIPSWAAMPAFRVLAKGRKLRGSKLDVFGRTSHRRAERARIGEYEALVEELCGSLTESTHGIAAQLASLPDDIRGFDTIKDESAAVVDEKRSILLDEYRNVTARGSSL